MNLDRISTGRRLALADRAAAMSRITIPPAYTRIFDRPARYRFCHGGRGAGRSWSFARALLRRALAKRCRILCGRELMSSISDSVHALLRDQISLLGLDRHFDVQAEAIYGDNGSEIAFAGLRFNVSKIKSFEGVDILWIEEAQSVSDASWRVLIPTIRRGGSEIWGTFNPDLESDPTYQRFVVNAPDQAIVVKTTYEDNPHFPSVLELERQYLQRVDPDAHSNIWLGECRRHSDAQILAGKVFSEPFEPQDDWDGPYFGLDFGFSQDPTAGIKAYIHGRTLFVVNECWGIGVEIDALPTLLDQIPGARKHTIRADNARPESISYLRRNGFPEMVAAEKGAGSVQDGIAHLRQYERIVIHPRCVHTLEEARLYSYKVDRLSGDVLPDPIDRHNHLIDALRYALEPIAQGGEFSEWLKFAGEQFQRGIAATDLPRLPGEKESPRQKRPSTPAPQNDLLDTYMRAYDTAGRKYLPAGDLCGHCRRPLQPGAGYIECDGRWHEECHRERSSFNGAGAIH